MTCGVGRHSIRSLHTASLDAYMMAGRFPDLDRVAPALRKGSLSEKVPPQQFAGEEGTNKLSKDRGLCEHTPPWHFALEEETTKLTEVPPHTQHEFDLDQLRVVIMAMQIAVQKFAEHSFGEQKAEHSNNNTTTTTTTQQQQQQ